MSTRRRWWVDLKALAVPVVTYWGALLIGMATFTVLVLMFESNGPQDLLILASLVASCVLSVGFGQAMALVRLRTWAIVALSAMVWTLVLVAGFGVTQLGSEALAMPLFILLALGPFWSLAGVWSLRVQGALLATWAPLMWLVVSILFVSERTGGSGAWFAGDKWAVWDVITAPILLFGVVLMLLYLVSRELHRLHRWRFGPGGPDLPRVERTEGAKRARLGIGCGGMVALAGLALALTLATALVAPYLWRTGEAEEEDGEGSSQTEQTRTESSEQPPQQGCNQQSSSEEGDGGQSREPGDAMETLQEATRQAAGALVNLLLLLLLAIAIGVVFGPPVRRQLLLTHLRRSLWPVPPTREIDHSWRLVEVALADHGVRRQPRETRLALARRAVQSLPDMDHLPLEVLAEVADRVHFGLGLRPNDTMRARRAAEMAFQTLWDRLSEAQKVRATYRWL